MYRYDQNIQGSNFMVIKDDAVDESMPPFFHWLNSNWTQAAGYIIISKESCLQLPLYVYISGEQTFTTENNYQTKFLDQKYMRYFDEQENQFYMKEISSKRNRVIWYDESSNGWFVGQITYKNPDYNAASDDFLYNRTLMYRSESTLSGFNWFILENNSEHIQFDISIGQVRFGIYKLLYIIYIIYMI